MTPFNLIPSSYCAARTFEISVSISESERFVSSNPGVSISSVLIFPMVVGMSWQCSVPAAKRSEEQAITVRGDSTGLQVTGGLCDLLICKLVDEVRLSAARYPHYQDHIEALSRVFGCHIDWIGIKVSSDHKPDKGNPS